MRFSLATSVAIVLTATIAAGDSHFLHVRKDAAGHYLWEYPENWSFGAVPNSTTAVEIGEDSSREARHCVIKSDAHSLGMQLAEHALTEGSSLWITEGSSLTIHGSDSVLSKDRLSFTTIDGVLDSSKPNSTLRIGGPWGQPFSGLPSAAHVYVSSTGSIRSWFIGLNTSHRANNAPSSPWGPDYWGRATESEIIVDGGQVYAQEGMRMSTAIADRPGKLILKGSASLTMDSNPTYGFQMWAGIWEIEGGDADVQIGKLELWGNKYEGEVNGKYGWPVGSGVSVLKFSGDGVSTIHANGVADFIDAALVDVSGLDVPNGTYTLVDATSLNRTNLQLASGTDTDVWSLQCDTPNGDVLLTRGSSIIMGDVDLNGYVEDYDLSMRLAYWDYGASWTQGDLNGNGTVDDDDLSLLLANWNTGTPPAGGETVPEPATLLLLAAGSLALVRRRRLDGKS